MGKSTGSALTDAIDKATRTTGAGITTRFSTHGTTAGRNFGSSFNTSVAQSVPASGAFNSALSGYSAAASKAGAGAGRAMGLAFTTAAGGLIGAAGYTIFKGFERYQSIDAAKNRLENLNRTMTSTGRAGIDVGRVMETVTEAVTGTPFAMDQAMSLATRALSSATGPLDRFLKVTTDGAAFAGRDIESIGAALLKVANTGKVSMEELQNELAGIPILPALQQQFGVTGAELSKMISDGKVGLEDLMTAIETTSGGLAKSAGDTIAGAMENAQTAVARIGANLLGSVFGKPVEDGNDLVDVLKTMTARLDDVNAWVTGNSGRIREVFQQGVEVAGDLADAIKWIIDQLNRMGIGIDDVVKTFIAWKAIQGVTTLTSQLGGINTMLSTGLPGAADKGAKGISAALSRIAVPAWLTYLAMENGPELEQAIADSIPGGNTFNNLPTPADAGKATRDWIDRNIFGEGTPNPVADWGQQQLAPAGTRESGGLPPVLPAPSAPTGGREPGWGGDGATPSEASGPPSGSPILPAPGTGADSAGGPKLPDAPVVPYDTTLPPGIAGMAPDASVFSAESSFLDARHALAEKQARLNQLLASNQATEQDILNARNDVASEERDFQAAEMRMHEARQNQLESMTKQAKGTTSELSELGSQLDQDFGISKGLGGIVENITKFLGNLIAAPALQALGMIDKANPNQGSGLIGMLASQGAFGPQYTPEMLAAAQMGPAALQPGYGYPGATYGSPGTAQPGESDRAFAHRVMKPFFEQQGLIVGDHAADKYGEHQNGALDIMVDSIAEGNQVLQQVLSDPNVYGAIFNNKAYGYGQGPGARPYSGGNTGNPTQDHQDHVHAWYKPGGANNIAPSSPTWQGPTPSLPTSLPSSGSLLPGAGAPMSPALGIPAAPTYGVGAGLGQAQPALPGVGSALGQAQPGVSPGNSYPSQGGNSGNIMGGLALDGAMAATAGLDMLAPGAGAAAKIGIQLLNRTVGYASQNAGILASGALETLSLGDNPRGSLGGGWLGKIVGGLAGAAPALPNLAGGAKAPMQGDQSQQGGNTYGDTNINVTAREGASGQEHGEQIASHKEAMFAPVGRQP